MSFKVKNFYESLPTIFFCHLRVGTIGYSREEGLNDFYPANTPVRQMLSHYAQTLIITVATCQHFWISSMIFSLP